MNRIDRLYMEMIHYYQGDPKHIQHFVKVHDLSRLIGQSEGLDEDTMYVLEAANSSRKAHSIVALLRTHTLYIQPYFLKVCSYRLRFADLADKDQ